MRVLAGFLQKILWRVFAPFLKFLFRLELKTENKEKDFLTNLKGPLIIAANHYSWLDPFLIGISFPPHAKVFPIQYGCLYKYYYFPLFFPFLYLLGAFPIRSKKGGLENSLKKALMILENKGVVGIFPEGARRRKGRPKKGRRGAAFLAVKTGTPILPVKIEGALNMSPWEVLLRKRKILIKIGKPFFLPQKEIKKPEDLNEDADYIMKTIRNL
jgi:1-acyl-sn-glycerol-3-phosphate acyltransferase